MKFGYARVSTQDQNLDSQYEELKKLGAENIFIEKASGKNLDRIELKKMFEFLRESDLVIVVKLDRLARSLKDLIFLIEQFSEKKIILQIGNLKLDFSTAEGRLYASLFGAVGQFERELIRERTMLGLKYAREKGRIGGKPKGLSEQAKITAKKAYDLRLKELTQLEILKAQIIKSKP